MCVLNERGVGGDSRRQQTAWFARYSFSRVIQREGREGARQSRGGGLKSTREQGARGDTGRVCKQ